MHVDLDGEGPLHAQLTRAMREAIVSGRLAAGTRLPATRALAEALALSRNTVLAAYEQLAADGFVHARVGAGSYVADVARHAAPRAVAAADMPISALAARALALAPHRGAAQRRQLRYPLEYGLPLVTPALQSAWKRALSRAADDTPFDYPPAEGLPALRTAIAGYLGRRRGLLVDPEDVLVVGGTQEGLDLATRVLLEPGAQAVVEDPCYQGTRQSLAALGAEVHDVPVDGDGLVVDALPEAHVRLACVTPSHQFPRGSVLSLERRFALLAWAARSGACIVEDDYDGEFRHDGRPLAALKALDTDGRVIYLGSFSKVLFPALRLGYMVVPPSLREAFRACKWLVDRGCPAIEQQALATLIDSGRFERLLHRTGLLLAERRRALLDALQRDCAPWLETEGAAAGMHLTAWLRQHAPHAVDALIEAAARRGVGVYSLARYQRRALPRAALLLGYSGLAPAQLAEAARRLAAALQETAGAG